MNARAPDANPLDAWVAGCLGLAGGAFGRGELVEWQMARLADTVGWAKQRSPFYRRLLTDVDERALKSPADLRRLPFTTAADLRRNDPPLLCVSQSEISRVVTLDTSGTSGPPKRLFFTADDQASTIDFFAVGMSVFTRPGDRVAILFPGERPGSVGDLLARALLRLGAEPIAAGWPVDPAATAALIARERPDVVAGAPVAVLAVARCGPPMRVRSVLLSSDHAAASLRGALAERWGCEVFEHYGMTETGLGGGVDCGAHAGYHMRENELLLEIVDPVSGQPMAPGEAGEVVFTTLTRRGLPLIRYRTGDLSRVLPGECACGSPLVRLQRILGRIGAGVDTGVGTIAMAALDEVLFAFPEVLDFTADYCPEPPPSLRLEVLVRERGGNLESLGAALADIPVLARAIAGRGLRLALNYADNRRLCSGAGKRRIALHNAP